MRPDRPIRIWALLGDHRGDNNQVLALAESLGLPFEAKSLEYRKDVRKGVRGILWRALLRAMPPTLIGLTARSRAMLTGELPDLVIAIGSRTAGIVRILRRRSRGRILTVQLGNPRVSPSHFDLVITTPQYPVPDAPNVVRLPISIGRSFAHPSPSEATVDFFAKLPQPRRLLLLGGPTTFWALNRDDVTQAIATLLRDCQADGGSLVVLPSPRTPKEVAAAAQAAVASAPVPAVVAPLEGPPSYGELLGAAHRIFITADSVAMISEALRTGKPVGLVPVRATRWGKLRLAQHDLRSPDRPIAPRDLRYFWAALQQGGLVGTVEAPAHGEDPDVNRTAVALVRRLLAPQDRPAIDGRDNAPSAPASQAEHIQA